eukprot:CAMPEP_0182884650 /NCGR_PEP_ID=MMETSP0034_2-20130328/19129_1 /TAXON_ID=156128 /ORGANISM="Nephroselmis pyriformis, Strain CCMP717" /LENGTH=274 /DNA_ID=CAMNT_0025017865 /DNA_START=8 /DNA_END=829 /DNA_ORIENTATION=-
MADMKKVWDHLVGPGYEDPRVASWPLIEDIRVPIAISAAYLLMIPVGTFLMKNREPMKIKYPAMLHNLFLFVLSAYMVAECVRACYHNFGWGKKFTPWCNALEPVQGNKSGFSQSGQDLANILWVHYVSKAYEFVDTLIMILKKNNRQVTFLHVYHHATTFFPVWFAVVKYGPGGEAWFCCFLNSLVHVFMYGYYFSASVGYPFTFIKKYITQFQMVQFLLFIAQSVYMLFVTDCYRPRLSPYMLLVQCIIFFALFFNFYVKNYSKKGGKGKGK